MNDDNIDVIDEQAIIKLLNQRLEQIASIIELIKNGEYTVIEGGINRTAYSLNDLYINYAITKAVLYFQEIQSKDAADNERR